MSKGSEEPSDPGQTVRTCAYCARLACFVPNGQGSSFYSPADEHIRCTITDMVASGQAR